MHHAPEAAPLKPCGCWWPKFKGWPVFLPGGRVDFPVFEIGFEAMFLGSKSRFLADLGPGGAELGLETLFRSSE